MQPTQSTVFLASITLLAAAVSTPLLAGDHEHDQRQNQRYKHQLVSDKSAADGFDHGMQTVSHDTAPDARAYGWRYYTDPATQRAVVISPQGDYYYSRGKGLYWIAAEQV